MRAISLGFIWVLFCAPAIASPVDESAFDREILPSLIRDLRGPDHYNALRRVMNLGPFAKAAGPELIRQLGTASDNDKPGIVMALGRMRASPEAAVPLLVEVMKDTHPWVRDAAFFALAEYGGVARPAVPAMLRLIEDNSIDRITQERAIELRGPIALAALPHYRDLIADRDDEASAHGLRMALLAVPGDPVAARAADIEMKHGSISRRCRLRAVLSDSGNLAPADSAEECAASGFHEKYARSRRVRRRMRLPPTSKTNDPIRRQHPVLKVRFELPKTKYFAGEAISAIPIPADDKSRAIAESRRPVLPESTWSNPGFNYSPTIYSSSGVPVEYDGAPVSSDMANMMMNGMVTPPPGSTYSFGKAATIFVRKPGRYKLAIPDSVAHLDTSTGPIVTVSADAQEIVVVHPSEEFIRQNLTEARISLKNGDPMTRGRAAERLRNLPDRRVLPILVEALEDRYKNVIVPAIYGLLEFPEPREVAREIRSAMDKGRPTDPGAMRWYAGVLSRTENGWHAPDYLSETRAEASAERWLLLLEHRRKKQLASRKLTPKEIVKGIDDDLVDPETPGVCAVAFNEILTREKDFENRGTYAVIHKCGSKAFSADLWKIARGGGFDGREREQAYSKLRSVGDRGWLQDVLSDMAADEPALAPEMNDIYNAALKERPNEVAAIIQRKLGSGEAAKARFAARFLAFLDGATGPGVSVPLDAGRLRRTLLAEVPLNEEVCMTVAYYLASRSPEDAHALAHGVIANMKKSRRMGESSAYHVLALLPEAVAGKSIRKTLNSSDQGEAAAMAYGLWMATMSPSFGSASSAASSNPTLAKYFPDLLAYFGRSSNGMGKQRAAFAMRAISGLPEDEPSSTDGEKQKLWISAWTAWQEKKPKEGKGR